MNTDVQSQPKQLVKQLCYAMYDFDDSNDSLTVTLQPVTGWLNMVQTISADGWLRLAPTGQKITLRSLDFRRLEHGLTRKNWVLVDLLHVYKQLGIDVLTRARQIQR